ncbi:MAG: hypothetical protein IKI82_01500 [Lachnospiraceae bacterium]|nr:hypothetical protein [Lachnospiraceae bacterium]
MKKRIMLMILSAVLLLTAALSGCSNFIDRRMREMREKAETYLSQMEKTSGVSDHFTLGETLKNTEKADPIGFSVASETYGKNFTVYVKRDGSEITDTYYALYLQDEADRSVKAAFEEASAGAAYTPSVSFRKGSFPALSRHAAGSLKELYALSGNEEMLEIRISTAGKDNMDDAQLDRLLLTLQKAGLYGTLTPYPSSSVWFEICPDGFWKNVQTGADSGAYLTRDAYTPAP